MRDLPAWWSSPTWLAPVHRWLVEVAGAVGCEVTGPPTRHRVRFWSCVVTVPTSAGRLWFKENAPSQSFEAALVTLVERLAPGHLVAPVAVEPGRGWLVTRDAGATMWAERTPEPPEWIRLLQEYAALQRAVEGHGPAIAETGVTTLPPIDSLRYVQDRRDFYAQLPAGHPLAPPAHWPQLIDEGLHRVAEDAAALDGGGIPMSLQHNDLHPGNAFGSVTEPLRLLDFGDAVWAHPFCAARIPLWLMRRRLGLAPDSAELARATDAYLEPWTDLAPLAALRDLMPAAERISCLHRAEAWHRVQQDVPAEVVDADLRDAAWTWLAMACAPDPSTWE